MRFKFLLIGMVSIILSACSTYGASSLQWDSKKQILISEKSQVKLRAIQTRIFDTTNQEKVMLAIVSLMQDLYFDIDVIENDLGIISGKKLYKNVHFFENDPSYFTYKTDNLISFSRNYRTYGPFQYRSDLIRLSVTIRPKGETQLIVRANIQYSINAVETPEIYQKFFKLLHSSIFINSSLG